MASLGGGAIPECAFLPSHGQNGTIAANVDRPSAVGDGAMIVAHAVDQTRSAWQSAFLDAWNSAENPIGRYAASIPHINPQGDKKRNGAIAGYDDRHSRESLVGPLTRLRRSDEFERIWAKQFYTYKEIIYDQLDQSISVPAR
jgi:hypothetical protein